jgi:hypothetical protein
MRALPKDALKGLSVVEKSSDKAHDKLLVEAIKAFPAQLESIIKNIPAPIIAPRPEGTWVIDVQRDSRGSMDKMLATFHETKNVTSKI